MILYLYMNYSSLNEVIRGDLAAGSFYPVAPFYVVNEAIYLPGGQLSRSV